MRELPVTAGPTRRQLLRLATGATAALAIGGQFDPAPAAAASRNVSGTGRASLHPAPAVAAILSALEREPLVAICERHMLQEWHDVIETVLNHPALSRSLNDIVVEFGNAAYQSVCDAFVLDGAQVPRSTLVQIWRQIGDPTWNAPVYEQLYRTVRAVNRCRPTNRRIRVVLGQAPVKMTQVADHPANRSLAQSLAAPVDDHLSSVIVSQVLSRSRRAVLIAGKGHLLRGLRIDPTSNNLNAITQVMATTRARPYVIDNLLLPPGPPSGSAATRAARELTNTTVPVIATLADTWLGATTSTHAGGWLNELADRAVSPGAARYANQADAVLYLGSGDTLTASQPDPSIYHWSDYPDDLERAAQLAGAGNQLALAIKWASTQPGYFNLFQ